MKIILQKNKKENGQALLLTILILGTVLAIALGISVLMLTETKLSNYTEQSAPAIFASESGIEQTLYAVLQTGFDGKEINNVDLKSDYKSEIYKDDFKDSKNNPIGSYKVYARINGGGGCPGQKVDIKSIGSYQNVNRALEISFCTEASNP